MLAPLIVRADMAVNDDLLDVVEPIGDSSSDALVASADANDRASKPRAATAGPSFRGSSRPPAPGLDEVLDHRRPASMKRLAEWRLFLKNSNASRFSSASASSSSDQDSGRMDQRMSQ
mmetsp:Transcript_42318/g.119666  ORF Transcript_42318/g.119666 Transcript_42318/m.119666 type:complete len:118 (-) Transcript_42318:1137-1490(-)